VIFADGGGDLVQAGEGRRAFTGLEEGDEFGGEADVLFQGTIAMPSETRRHLIQFVNRIINLYKLVPWSNISLSTESFDTSDRRRA
jgi:hypothetical protein